MYMVLNGKGCLTGCVLHGYSLASIPFCNRSIQYMCSLFGVPLQPQMSIIGVYGFEGDL